MKEPWFWRDTGWAASAVAAALSPASFIYDLGQRARSALARPLAAGTPVICIGNATLGGVGKTPFALMLQQLLLAHGLDAEFQTRGHGGALRGPVLVGDHHTADEVGDEPLLLAGQASTWVARNRAAGVAAAARGGAKAIIMDDGFQNPSIRKDFSVLLIDAADPAGNNRVFPAGPLREPLTRAAGRSNAIVLVGRGEATASEFDRPVFRASRIVETSITPRKAVAFCGVGAPRRFFAELEAKGFTLVARKAFADHHRYSAAEIDGLKRSAADLGATLITTEKDYVRLSRDARDGIAAARLRLSLDRPEAFVRLVLADTGLAG